MTQESNAIKAWLERHLADRQVVGLAAVLAGGFAIIYLAGGILAPVIASLIVAYLLEPSVGGLERRRVPRLGTVAVVFTAFVTTLVVVTFALLPMLSRQATQLAQQLPAMMTRGQDLLLALPQTYPELFSEAQVREVVAQVRAEALALGQRALEASLASVVGLLTALVYLILMPLMVFFLPQGHQGTGAQEIQAEAQAVRDALPHVPERATTGSAALGRSRMKEA